MSETTPSPRMLVKREVADKMVADLSKAVGKLKATLRKEGVVEVVALNLIANILLHKAALTAIDMARADKRAPKKNRWYAVSSKAFDDALRLNPDNVIRVNYVYKRGKWSVENTPTVKDQRNVTNKETNKGVPPDCR